MKNKMIDLNNHLFCQLERLSDEDLKGDKLTEEIERARAIAGVSCQIINNAKLVLDAHKAVGDGMIRKAPEMLGLEFDSNA